MSTKEIRTSQGHLSCDVCGRTLLRGERADTYVAGGHTREVCELCQPRALHEGWVREGAALERGARPGRGERRRGFMGRLRRGRPAVESGARPDAPSREHADNGARDAQRAVASEPLEPQRELRQVHAVPTNAEQRIATAVDRFNGSEHPRTVAGVARSLGEPVVVARPDEDTPSIVTVVVSWELCWYRYEVDLDGGGVRAAGQGYELEELDPADRVEANAVADEHGLLELV